MCGVRKEAKTVQSGMAVSSRIARVTVTPVAGR
jgi:hypothetical protein